MEPNHEKYKRNSNSGKLERGRLEEGRNGDPHYENTRNQSNKHKHDREGI